jgi:predicted nucleotidyltransferase
MSLDLPQYFKDFIATVRLQDDQKEAAKNGHRELRERITSDEELGPIVEATFLQGSYRRGTGVRPLNGARADVDVVVVTNLSRTDYPDPSEVFTRFFVPFVTKHYKDFDADRGHSIAIHLDDVDLDLVPTSAPSLAVEEAMRSASVAEVAGLDDLSPGEWRFTKAYRPRAVRSLADLDRFIESMSAEPEWKSEPLWIPNRDKKEWEETDPLSQLRFTTEKNAACNGHYLSVVRAVRWWRRRNPTPKYPKGYPVEHLVGHVLPDGIGSVAEGVVAALEGIRDRFQGHADAGAVPHLPDHGVPAHNVLGRLTGQDFRDFHALIVDAARQARDAYDQEERAEAVRRWRDLFGEEFPDDPDKGQGGFVKSSGPSTMTQTRWG